MKKVITTLIAVGALTISVQAQDSLFAPFAGNYTDVQVEQWYSGAAPIATPGPANTYKIAGDTTPPSFVEAFSSDGDADANNGWRWRSPSGGGAEVAYNANLFYGDDSGGSLREGYTLVGSGLTPGATYTIAGWAISGGTKDTIQYSLNQGATWGQSIDLPVINNPIAGADWLVNSTVDAVGTALNSANYPGGSTRFRIIIGDMQVDGAGELWVGARDPGYRSTGGGSDRMRIDGYSIAAGDVGSVPEPTTFALAGLGAAALLIFRRRS